MPNQGIAMKRIVLSLLLAVAFIPVKADISESDLADLKGYTILGSWTVTGWQDTGRNGKKGDSFEGCEHDRVIILDDSLTIKCDEYSYSYSYRPKAVILGNGSSFRMLLGGHIYRMKM
jgi:hypothetical protein